ncbi:MAG: NAD+ synthase [Bdellovibrionaceae bacterium]|nr:NAD+ synthase [Bdellovibrionales bacterium]MCB9085349.1 NAD+ synthase [Pseudobdellovibrionaceae bacterium]
MRVALAQINSILGDFAGNRDKIVEYCCKALDRRCDLVVFPEASLFGYHPFDLLERPAIVTSQERELKKLAQKIPAGIAVVVGAITKNPKAKGKPYHNSAVLLQKGKPLKIFPKQLLPTYDVFDEARHIEPGQIEKNHFTILGKKILVTICEDIWAWPDANGKSNYDHNPLRKLKGKFDLVINLSASPFTESKAKNRRRVVKETARNFRCPVVYVNMVGAQDELIFDGGSFATDKTGKIVAQSIHFNEDLNVIDLKTGEGGFRDTSPLAEEQIRQALTLGIRDFVDKTGLKRVHLGLSGGIDSAVVACLAADALGPHQVTCIGLPGPFNSPKSLDWSRQLATNLGVLWFEIPIDRAYEHLAASLEESFGKTEFGVMHENIQARLRGLLLMAYANREGSLLLNTSNKSELAMGYSTLYGDLCGGLCVIGDLLKSQVYSLARHYNSQGELIPKEIIERPPSAELRPNQKDEDSLPPYDLLDPAVAKLVVGAKSPNGPVEKRVLKSLMSTEFKRWQAPPILKVSDHAFGRGRRLPIAHKALY